MLQLFGWLVDQELLGVVGYLKIEDGAGIEVVFQEGPQRLIWGRERRSQDLVRFPFHRKDLGHWIGRQEVGVVVQRGVGGMNVVFVLDAKTQTLCNNI